MPVRPNRAFWTAAFPARRNPGLFAKKSPMDKDTVMNALKGVKYRPMGAAALLQRNLLVYGLGGMLVPFAGIKVLDLLLVALHLV